MATRSWGSPSCRRISRVASHDCPSISAVTTSSAAPGRGYIGEVLNRCWVYDLSVPLGWIGGDRDVAWQAERLVDLLLQSVIDAAIALSLYWEARELSARRMDGHFQRERFSMKQEASDRRYRELLAALDGPISMNDELRLQSEATRDAEREAFANGPPEGYVSRAPTLFAEQFVTGLAQTRRVLVQLAGAGLGSDAAISAIVARFEAALPGVVAVRDSLVHWDERVRGKARMKPIPPGRVDVPEFGGLASSGLLVVSLLSNDTFRMIADDGTAPGVEISDRTISCVVALAQQAIDALPWTKDRGWRRYSPQG
jgi:hypothetical protein